MFGSRSVHSSLRGRKPIHTRTRRRLSRRPLESLEDRRLLAADVIFSEINYHPVSHQVQDEWVELYNRGDAAANLQGYRIDNGVDFEFGDVSIAAGGYLVVAANVASFSTSYPSISHVVGDWNGRLSNSSERISLIDVDGELVDEVVYADSGDFARRRQELVGSDRYREGQVVPQLGWLWDAPHDGEGRSLELVNVGFDNGLAHNWAASETDGGSPGVVNGVSSGDIAPAIVDVQHSPVIPTSNDPVTVSAQLIDDHDNVGSAVLFHRVSTLEPGPFAKTPMQLDSSLGDGVYSATLPTMPNETIVEFYVLATDGAGNARSFPVATPEGLHEANLLYQVDDIERPVDVPFYRAIMTAAEWQRFRDGNRFNNAQMNATFVASVGDRTQLRYGAGVRYRASTRLRNPPSYRVNLPADRPWEGMTAMSINSSEPQSQIAGSALMAMAGIPAYDAFPVRMLHNGTDMSEGNYYAHVEPFNSEWAARHFPNDSAGNAYRGRRVSESPPGGAGANLVYHGEDPTPYGSYGKGTNRSEGDWSDIIRLTDVLNNTPEETYLEEVSKVVDIDQWLRVIGGMEMTGYAEYGFLTGDRGGDDWAMYRPIEDPRFLLVPHDLDSMFGAPSGGLFTANLIPILDKLIDRPSVVRRYYVQLNEIINRLQEESVRPVLENLLGSVVEQADIDNIVHFLERRSNYVLSKIASPLTIRSRFSTTERGLAKTSNATFSLLKGKTNALDTSMVLVAGQPATYVPTAGQTTRIGNWEIADVPLRPGVNRLLIQAMDDNGNEIDRTYVDIWREGTAVTKVSGTIDGDTIWTEAESPYIVSGDLTVEAAATLTIEPGTNVFFADGARMTVRGQLIAEGSQHQLIRFRAQPGTVGNWGGVQFVNSTADNRIHHAVIEYADTPNGMIGLDDSRLELDHVVFDHTEQRRIRAKDSELVIRNSIFTDIVSDSPPTGEGQSQHIWVDGVPAGGQLIFENNRFGRTAGESDSVRVLAARQPVKLPQVLNNLFVGGGGGALDWQGDAYIEGNRFVDFVHDPADEDPPVLNTISASAGDIYVVRNVFDQVEHAALVSEDAFVTFINNTVVSHQAALYFDLPGQTTGPGRGAHVVGSIFAGSNMPIQLDPAPRDGVTVEYSLLPQNDLELGITNLVGMPMFSGGHDEPFKLRSGSPAVGSGANGQDMGAAVPKGASLSGEPPARTAQTSASLTIDGPGITHYRYRLNESEFGDEIEIGVPIELANLTDGTYQVQVIGKNVVGDWQELASATQSQLWTVDTNLSGVVINEVLARNVTAVQRGDASPDLVELYNVGATPIDLAGMSMTDDPSEPRKFVFSQNVTLAAGEYLVLVADDPDDRPGIHLGFGLDANGDALYLFDGPELVDSVEFGLQITDRSLGRDRNGDWTLVTLSFGEQNLPIPVGDPSQVRINEWLADGETVVRDDFVELHNPDPSPVALGQTFLTDNPVTWPDRHAVPPLSFLDSNSTSVFIADGNPENGGNHLDFRISRIREMLAFSDSAGNVINQVYFGPQATDTARARYPDSTQHLYTVTMPTPGLLNPGPGAEHPVDFDPQDVELFEHLRISEVMFNPIGGSEFEFVEFQNTGSETLRLDGVSIEGGINFTFSDWELPAGQFVVLVNDAQSFQQRYGNSIPVAGEYRGNLSNAGERLRLRMPSPHQINLLDFVYDDRWYEGTNGDGFSLEIVDPQNPNRASWSQRQSWRASAQTGGSPGQAEGISPPIAGDANRDGVFDAEDLVFVFAAGKYEDGIADNATFEEGDWDGDGDFTSADIVFAFIQGNYVPSLAAVDEVLAAGRGS